VPAARLHVEMPDTAFSAQLVKWWAAAYRESRNAACYFEQRTCHEGAGVHTKG
jgi:hypothetical protein